MPLQLLFPVVMAVCCLTQATLAEDARSEIRRLRSDLLSATGHDPLVPPQKNITERVPVAVEFFLDQAPVLDTQRHLFQAEITICMSWTDFRVTWDPALYGGFNEIIFKRSEVWFPFLVDTSARGSLDTGSSPGGISAKSDGRMRHCYSSTPRETCIADLSKFPYDQHKCDLWYSRRQKYALSSVHVKVRAEDTSAEYGIINITSGAESDYENHGYAYVSFVLRRRNQLHGYTILVPTAVVLVSSLLVFWLPPGSERKVTLACACFLTTIILLHRVSEVVSEAKPVPKLVKVLGAMSLIDSIIILSAVISVSMANCSATSTFRPPSFVAKLSEGLLGRLLCICPPPFSEQEVRGDSVDFKVQKECYIAAQIVDRLFFVVILTTFVAIVC